MLFRSVFAAQLVICLPASALQGVSTAAMIERIPPALRGRGFSLFWALAMGFIGGLLPALRAARLPIPSALREL